MDKPGRIPQPTMLIEIHPRLLFVIVVVVVFLLLPLGPYPEGQGDGDEARGGVVGVSKKRKATRKVAASLRERSGDDILAKGERGTRR